MVNFPTQIPYCGSHSPAILFLYISSDPSICSIDDDAPFHRSAFDYSCAD